MNDKDQAAIDHVASVSKHPHAAMIVKWLITGWDVEFLYKDTINDYNTAPFPSWHPDTVFRLIEPKPEKPAYRVFIEPGDGEPRTVTRKHYNKHSDSYDDKVDWISDWEEYDPPKKWPTPLVERIAAIDLEAAQWIVKHWDDLLEDRYTRKGMYDRESQLLSHSFDWSESDIGAIFWEEISTKLGE